MLTPEQFKKLRKVNISKDTEKTKTRIGSDFKSTTRNNKNTIVSLSGLKRATFYRVFDTGAATARVILSMAQTLNVSPYYYIGTEDEKGQFSEIILMQFLQEHGYETLIKEIQDNSKRTYNNLTTNADPKTNLLSNQYELLQTMNANEPIATYESHAETIDHSAEDSNNKVTFTITLVDSQKIQDAIINLDEESAILLLKALIRRANANENAEILCELVKRCLLT